MSTPFSQTRGVVLTPEDVSLRDWPERAGRARLTTIALHPFPSRVLEFVRSEAGDCFLASCHRLGIEVEYELHAISELLPRQLFAQHPRFFRMGESGVRVPDANLCVHSAAALEIVAESALEVARQLRPSTGRYFLWGDDGQPWCRCASCRGLSDSDQALVFENHLIRALRRLDPSAQLAHLAYASTLSPPAQVKPEKGIFLEYAPIRRRYNIPFEQQTAPRPLDPLSALDANLAVFPVYSAQALEYWLDVSRFSHWRRPAVQLPWRADLVRADLATYAARGIRHITSFAVFVDADYCRLYGEPAFVADYGRALQEARGMPRAEEHEELG